VAEHDEDLQAQHKYLKGKVDMLEVGILWSQQTLSALPPVDEGAADEGADIEVDAADADEVEVDDADLFE
jgi:hypothetical protein